MLVTESRPRTLKWFHAGPLLYGDWGTSRLYVLGLAFFYTGAESLFYLVAIALLMAAVAWAYTIVCRCFPDGGGVYTAARQLSPTFSVVGATLLLCGYLITAAISVVEALHYFGMPDGWGLAAASAVIIALIGGVNWLGAKSAGQFALIIAFAALAVSGVMALLCLPYLPEGLSKVHFDVGRSAWSHWTDFTQIVLALAGVEAVANMTGLMKKPVAREAKRTIWPVLIEVVGLNLLFGVAMTAIFLALPALRDVALPLADSVAGEGGVVLSPEARAAAEEIKNTAMEVIATTAAENALGETAGRVFGNIAAIVFGLLLLSATNTAVMAMVSVLYAMAQDRELPHSLTRLNYSGVPSIALLISLVLSVAVVVAERRPEKLAELYIIGVCGAITSTVMSCAINGKLGLSRAARTGMWALGLFLLAVSLTIVVTTLNATLFAGAVVGIVLAMRFGRRAVTVSAPTPMPEPIQGWLEQVRTAEPLAIDPSKPRIMLAARGRYQSEFAVDLARRRRATLFAIYVRTLRVMDVVPGRVPRIEDDRDAQEALGTTALLAKSAGVPFLPIYVTSTDIPGEILDYTVTYGCDTLIMGKSKRSMFARKIEGDVVSKVAEALPDDVALITRAATTPHVGLPIEIPEGTFAEPGPAGQAGPDIGQSDDGEPPP